MEKKSLLVLIVMLSVMVFSGCSHTPSHRRVCAKIQSVPEFGFVFVDGKNLGNAPVSKCFSVGYDQTGHRMFDGFVKWVSGETKRFRIRMNIDSSYTYTIFHPPGESIKDAQSYADSMLRKRAIDAQEEAASAARQQAEAQEKAAKDRNFWETINYINSNPDLFK